MSYDLVALIVFYIIPCCICILASWAEQLLDKDAKPEAEYFFSFIAFIPIGNILGVMITLMILVGWIGLTILNLPTIIKLWMKP